MKQDAGLVVTLGVALAFSCIAVSGEPDPPPVTGHEFKDISAPRVTGVFWTRRETHFTLQVQFDAPPGSGARQRNLALAGLVPEPVPATVVYPDVRIQLRDRDGTEIPYLGRLAVDPGMKAQTVLRGALDGVRRSEVVYTFHLGDGERAESLTLQIDGREFVQKVPQLD